MSYQETSSDLNDTLLALSSATKLKTKPKLGCEADDTNEDYYIEISLPNTSASVLTGSGNQWILSQIYLSSSIQEMVVLEGDVQTQNFEETDLNMATYSSPKRVEIYTTADPSATPYVVIQEVVSKGIQGWQIYSPVPFIIETAPNGKGTWQTAMSSEYVSIQQVRVYENCDYNVQLPPPPGSTPLFEMATEQMIGEVDVQS